MEMKKQISEMHKGCDVGAGISDRTENGKFAISQV